MRVPLKVIVLLWTLLKIVAVTKVPWLVSKLDEGGGGSTAGVGSINETWSLTVMRISPLSRELASATVDLA